MNCVFLVFPPSYTSEQRSCDYSCVLECQISLGCQKGLDDRYYVVAQIPNYVSLNFLLTTTALSLLPAISQVDRGYVLPSNSPFSHENFTIPLEYVLAQLTLRQCPGWRPHQAWVVIGNISSTLCVFLLSKAFFICSDFICFLYLGRPTNLPFDWSVFEKRSDETPNQALQNVVPWLSIIEG